MTTTGSTHVWVLESRSGYSRGRQAVMCEPNKPSRPKQRHPSCHPQQPPLAGFLTLLSVRSIAVLGQHRQGRLWHLVRVAEDRQLQALNREGCSCSQPHVPLSMALVNPGSASARQSAFCSCMAEPCSHAGVQGSHGREAGASHLRCLCRAGLGPWRPWLEERQPQSSRKVWWELPAGILACVDRHKAHS